jgi:hypothetical protein
MEATEFVKYAKKYAVDDTVKSKLRELASPRTYPETEPKNEIQCGISEWIDRAVENSKQRSAWFTNLDEEGREQVRALLQECGEHTLFSLFCLLDGVDGHIEGVFEIVHVDDEENRTVLNPQNTEMLHDLFSDVVERDRGLNSVEMDSRKNVQ